MNITVRVLVQLMQKIERDMMNIPLKQANNEHRQNENTQFVMIQETCIIFFFFFHLQRTDSFAAINQLYKHKRSNFLQIIYNVMSHPFAVNILHCGSNFHVMAALLES